MIPIDYLKTYFIPPIKKSSKQKAAEEKKVQPVACIEQKPVKQDLIGKNLDIKA